TQGQYDGTTKSSDLNHQHGGRKPQIYEFNAQNTLDPITAVYVARSVDFKVGDRLYFNVCGGRYRYLLELLVERKEPVELESGKVVEAYKIIPFIQNTTKGGYEERLREATIWFFAYARLF